MKHKFIHIIGINHLRVVGVCKETGKAADFYFLNYKGYRPPKTDEELQDCINKAKSYYTDCENFGTTVDEFGWEDVDIGDLLPLDC